MKEKGQNNVGCLLERDWSSSRKACILSCGSDSDSYNSSCRSYVLNQ